MKVLVYGGRDYYEEATVHRVLDLIHQNFGIDKLINGGASGADWLARVWARLQNPPVEINRFDADWRKHGKSAGPIRNQQMLNARPDLGVEFPGGRGTADMNLRLWQVRIPIFIFEDAEQSKTPLVEQLHSLLVSSPQYPPPDRVD